MSQSGGSQLPPELGAKIFSMLPLRDLLRSRLTSQAFVQLKLVSAIFLNWTSVSAANAPSLMLFVSRHLQQEDSPTAGIVLNSTSGLQLSASAHSSALLIMSSVKFHHMQHPKQDSPWPTKDVACLSPAE